jgi:tetratricopeptide (TPR) repeat protein
MALWKRLMMIWLGLMVWLSQPQWAMANPSDLQAGIAAYERGEFQTALEHLNQQIDTDPHLAVAWGNRCLAKIQLSRYAQAIVDCDQAIALDSQNPEYRLSRGLAKYRSGDYSEALQDNRQFLEVLPGDYRGFYNEGLVYVALHQFTQAIEDFNQALALAPETAIAMEIFDDRGLAQLMADNPEGAIADFNRALAINPDNLRALLNRSCACSQLQRLPEAMADLNQVLAMAPDHVLAYYRRGLLRFGLNDHHGATTDLQEAAQQAQFQGMKALHHHILTVLNTWQNPGAMVG